MFAFYLFSVATFVPAARSMFLSPSPTGFASAASQTPEDGTGVQLAGTGLFQSWGEQAECWEHKQGVPVGQGLELA